MNEVEIVYPEHLSFEDVTDPDEGVLWTWDEGGEFRFQLHRVVLRERMTVGSEESGSRYYVSTRAGLVNAHSTEVVHVDTHAGTDLEAALSELREVHATWLHHGDYFRSQWTFVEFWYGDDVYDPANDDQ